MTMIIIMGELICPFLGAGLKALVLICLFLAWKASRAHQKVEAAKQEMANAPAVPAVLEEKDAAVQTD